MTNIADRLREHARARPDHPAIIDGPRTIRYSDLDDLVQRTAAVLRGAGVGTRDIVGLCLRDSADHLVLHFAVARLGAVILPMDVRWTGAEKTRVAGHFGARLVVVEPADALAEDRDVLMIDDEWPRSVAAANAEQSFPGDSSLPLVLSLSSGTTGRPKGPMISHHHMLARFENQRVNLTFRAKDRYLSATPLYFGAGRHFALGYLFAGASVVLFPPPFEAQAFVEAVAATAASVTIVVPTVLRRLLEMPARPEPLLAGLRVLYSTGAVLQPDERTAILEKVSANLVNYYGSTEGGGISVLRPDVRGAAATSVGRPLPGTDVQIVDEAGQGLAPGRTGHIRYRGAGVADEFHNDPEASRAAFRDGWFYPGDLGRFDDDGYLFLAGRAKDMIVRGGVNIYPEEVEHVLLEHDDVRDAAVVAWPSPARGEDVAAFVVVGAEVKEAELIDHCGGSLAPYKVPRRIFFVREFPRNAMGKVRKFDLAAGLPVLDD